MRRFRDILTFIALGPIWLPLLLIVGLTLSVMSTALFLTPLTTLPGDESPRKEASDRSWVAQADAILATLSNLDLKPVNTATLEPSKDVRLAEELLWKLWLTTGMPPLLWGDAPPPFDAYTRANAVAYRQYIAKHQHLGFDELQRMSPLKKMSLGLASLALLWTGAVQTLKTHDDAFTEDGLLEANAANLKDTIVTPHLEVPVADDSNILWCATFQLAWNEACALVEEDLHFEGNEPAMVGVLNHRSFTREHLDKESYVAVAGFVKDDIFGQIDRQLQDTFKGRATPHYIPPKSLTPRPQDIVAYSYLFKNLEFPVPFERLGKPLVFGATAVPCFGIGEERKTGHAQMREQLLITDYRTADDFVVELKTKGTQDKFILAKVQPAATLAETIKAVLSRVASATPVHPQMYDVLKIPKLNFDITREYQELEHLKLVVKNPNVARDLQIVSALQNIRFQLDEEGVRLRSESHISFGCAAPRTPPPAQHIMVFDKPFLMLLLRRDADVPYFALWVRDPEILVKAIKP